jgi:hypothetical protein
METKIEPTEIFEYVVAVHLCLKIPYLKQCEHYNPHNRFGPEFVK